MGTIHFCRMSLCYLFTFLLRFAYKVSAFVSVRSMIRQQQRCEYLSLQPSFIDMNEVIDTEISHNFNSGLGKEKIVYFDDDMIVVDKPTCCSTAPGFRATDSLATRIAGAFRIDRVDKMIVHRLDYATSGLIIFARNNHALCTLHTQFRQKRKIYKRYSAVVKGYIKTFEGEIDLPLGKKPDCPPLCMVDTLYGKESSTSWSLFGRHRGNSHVHLIPHTGRTHQLRIHMASIDHPIVGDLFYAPRSVYKESDRLLLHAEELRIMHPRTNKPMRFIAKCPFSLYD